VTSWMNRIRNARSMATPQVSSSHRDRLIRR
jgi:hypothetical protein